MDRVHLSINNLIEQATASLEEKRKQQEHLNEQRVIREDRQKD